MDVHRCRFVPYPPSAINALAFSHPSPTSRQEQAPADLRLAIGRENGSIEIWKPQDGDWLHETTLWGGKDRTIDALTWIYDADKSGQNNLDGLRLFSIGHSTVVTEWNLVEGIPLRQCGGNHGEIWCIAAQPRGVSAARPEGSIERQDLALGCVDGSVIILSTADNDLTYSRTLARPVSKKAQVLSITFKDRNTVVTGCADSKIRVYNFHSGSLLRSMSLGAGPKMSSKDRLVWSIKCLPDGTIVSGDATGEIRFWDGKTFTLMQRLRSHVADIFEVEVSPDGEVVFSGSMDRRTVVYKRTGSSNNSQHRRWAETSHRRFHTHDVKAFAAFDSSNLSVLVSGGLDATPIIMPLKQLGVDHHRKLPSLPQQSPVLASTDKNLLVTYFDQEVRIWRITKMALQESSADDEHQLIARIAVLGEENITSVSISSDGSLLALATSANVKLFQLRLSATAQVKKLKLPMAITNSGARLVAISPDCRWLAIVSRSSKISMYRIADDHSGIVGKGSRLRRLHRTLAFSSYDRTITQLAFSADSRILVACDLAGFLDSWTLGRPDADVPMDGSSLTDSDSSSDNDLTSTQLTLDQRWTRSSTLPRLPSACVTLSFRPSPGDSLLHDEPEDRLLVITSTHKIFEFSVSSGSFTEWSRRNPPSTFPAEYLQLRDLPKGCVWDVEDGKQRVWVYGISWVWMFDLAQDFANQSIPESRKQLEAARSREDKSLAGSTGQTSTRKRKRQGLGAGSRISDKQITFIQEDEPTGDRPYDDDEDSSIEYNDDSDDMAAFAQLRRQSSPNGIRNGISNGTSNGDGHEKTNGTSSGTALVAKSDSPSSWHTFKYRPILGMAAIGGPGGGSLEVALVERPLWDADLPARFYGDQEWDTK